MEHAGPSINRMSVYCHFKNFTHSFIGGLIHVININLKVKSKIVTMYVDLKGSQRNGGDTKGNPFDIRAMVCFHRNTSLQGGSSVPEHEADERHNLPRANLSTESLTFQTLMIDRKVFKILGFY